MDKYAEVVAADPQTNRAVTPASHPHHSLLPQNMLYLALYVEFN